MRVIQGKKYKVIAEFHHFNHLGDATERRGFALFEGEEYKVDYIYDMQGCCYINLGQHENEFGEKISRTISLDTFKNCFEETQ